MRFDLGMGLEWLETSPLVDFSFDGSLGLEFLETLLGCVPLNPAVNLELLRFPGHEYLDLGERLALPADVSFN